MRVLVTGSRDWTDQLTIYRALLEHVVMPHWEKGYDRDGHVVDWVMPSDFVLVHGHCPTGADAIADDWVIGHDRLAERHPAQWIDAHGHYNRGAGFRRNTHMVYLGADLCLAFILNNSKGATHTANLAEKAGIRTIRYTEQEQ